MMYVTLAIIQNQGDTAALVRVCKRKLKQHNGKFSRKSEKVFYTPTSLKKITCKLKGNSFSGGIV
jgi:hypothetical protein